jgi:hypothetical protein
VSHFFSVSDRNSLTRQGTPRASMKVMSRLGFGDHDLAVARIPKPW